ncbi:ISL3 family transposase [Pseudonocardia nigra]|uniref:ISL3 family transposase n=1 Tax=Pseudonocardia nigra TaxID=1921578 RepID=UPI001C5E84BB|nr:ISL3 family transposase [Pseudonocardia nigra]
MRAGATVAGQARTLGVSWHTVMRQVRAHGEPAVHDPARLDGVTAIGVDEHAWQRAGLRRRTQYATGIMDLTPGRPARLLDVVEGRSGTALRRWLAARPPAWRAQISTAALDPFRGYATALADQLPAATRVLDPFHVCKLGLGALDDVRRRVQQHTLGHRGHTHDPLYRARRLLRRRADRLDQRGWQRLRARLDAGDPNGEVTAAWVLAQDLMAAYPTANPATGRTRAEKAITDALSCPVPEVARLGRTLRAWRAEMLAYFDTARATSNGPTEAVNLLIETTRRAERARAAMVGDAASRDRAQRRRHRRQRLRLQRPRAARHGRQCRCGVHSAPSSCMRIGGTDHLGGLPRTSAAGRGRR